MNNRKRTKGDTDRKRPKAPGLAPYTRAPIEYLQQQLAENKPPDDFVKALAMIAPKANPVEVANLIIHAYIDSWINERTRLKLRQPAFDAAKTYKKRLVAERKALIAQQSAATDTSTCPMFVVFTAAYLRRDRAGRKWNWTSPADPTEVFSDWPVRDADRLSELDTRIAQVDDAIAALHGRGDSASRLRDFADELAPIYHALTGLRPTETRRKNTSSEAKFNLFGAFVAASAALFSEVPKAELIEGVNNEIARAWKKMTGRSGN